MPYQNIIKFWFDDIDSKFWWQKDPEFDQLITRQFKSIHSSASLCELFSWRSQPLGRLAEIIVLDQFSRNIYRNQPLAYNSDSLALALAQEAVALNVHQEFNKDQKLFLFLPFMHSESVVIHQQATILFNEKELQPSYEFEIKHKQIIDRFGRYPHRNKTLGRISTDEEIEFLKQPGSAF